MKAMVKVVLVVMKAMVKVVLVVVKAMVKVVLVVMKAMVKVVCGGDEGNGEGGVGGDEGNGEGGVGGDEGNGEGGVGGVKAMVKVVLVVMKAMVKVVLVVMKAMVKVVLVIDAELHVNQESFVNHYFWTTEDDYLKTDLIKNIYFCKEASDGLPLERDHSPLHARLHRLMFFLKCEKKKRLAACLKHDLRANLDDDLSGLPGSDSRREAVSEVLALLVGADGINNLDLYG
ncbi:hypothetical protein GWK47_029650 [Chionoecetes opilio]|uniref:Uncharacterized protein n=1 Tax=Chionoecetes opilio TaxID=41210 RepID=A0A8J4YMY1_CHIOP|nr:hypothetical protein GWK47_029650 [Chionoecetes opilio]